MEEHAILSLSNHFTELSDPRIKRQKLHQLKDILVIAICAMLCGEDNWVEIGRFGKVFAAIDAGQFGASFIQ